MANELLDFVMSLVRDPDIAARYAADPAQAIADAHLTDVSSVDVNNLIPMVSDSLSMASPGFGADSVTDSNVWTSGAATAALDAFSPHAGVVGPDAAITAFQALPSDVIDSPVIDTSPGPADALDLPTDLPTDPAPTGIDAFDPSSQLTGMDHVVDGGYAAEDHGAWDHSALEPHTAAAEHPVDGSNDPGFDIFD